MSPRRMTKAEIAASRRATAKADRAFATHRRRQEDLRNVMPLLVLGGISLAVWIADGGWSA